MAATVACALALAGSAIVPLAGLPVSTAVASSTAGAISSPGTCEQSPCAGLLFAEGRSATMAAGTAKRLKLMCASAPVLWCSSDERVTTVDQTGLMQARRPGLSVITARSVSTGKSAICIVKVYKKVTQKKARKAILSLRKTYRPGRTWTNADHYFWQAAHCHCYGCVAFVGIASDKAFGTYAPIKRHAAFSKIRIGDHVRVGGRHSVIVTRKRKKSIVVAEGNYNATFKWGRVITRQGLKRQGFYVETRY